MEVLEFPRDPKRPRDTDDARRKARGVWYYEEEKGLQFYVSPSEVGIAFVITPSQMRAYLKRLEQGRG